MVRNDREVDMAEKIGLMEAVFGLAKASTELIVLFKKNAKTCRECGRPFKYVWSPYDGADYDKELCMDCNRAKKEGVETLAQRKYKEGLAGKKTPENGLFKDLFLMATGQDVEQRREYERTHPVREDAQRQGVMAKLPLGKPVLIDGSNLFRADKANNLRAIVTCVQELKERGLSCVVIFDANIEHLISEIGDGHTMAAFNRMRELLGKNLVIAPRGQRADDIILQVADVAQSHIISNDQFRQFAHRYSWIEHGDRLHKFSMVADQLVIADLDMCVPLLPEG